MKNNSLFLGFRPFAALLFLLFPLLLCAQPDLSTPHPQKRHHEVADVVKDLTTSQKRKVESISKDSRTRIDVLRRQQRSVLDSIDHFMSLDGDQSVVLFPLFERDASLRAAISREMYSTRVAIDQVLSPAQRQLVRQAAKRKPAARSHPQ